MALRAPDLWSGFVLLGAIRDNAAPPKFPKDNRAKRRLRTRKSKERSSDEVLVSVYTHQGCQADQRIAGRPMTEWGLWPDFAF